MDDLKIALVLPEALKDPVLHDRALGGPVQAVTPFPRADALQFGLEELAAVVTIVVGTLQLGEYCLRLAQTLKAANKPGMYVLVRTSRDDTVVRLERYQTAEELADALIDAASKGR